MSGASTISVVIPCRNMGAYVGAAIDSVFAQTYAVHEVIVVDDKSEDNTLQVLESFGRRITVLKGPGRGSSVARNLGILAATGDHIAFLDADDLWLPHKLERQAKLLSAECGFVFADWYRSDSPDKPGAVSNTLDGVSCFAVVSGMRCFAVGNWSNDVTGSPFYTLTERWNGTGWVIVASPNVSGQIADFRAQLNT